MQETITPAAPVIGTGVPRITVDPFDVAHLREPYALQKLLRDAGPVFWLEQHGTYGVAGFAEVQQVLQDPARFSSAAGVGLAHLRRPGAWREPNPLVESDPPQHTQIRRAMDQILAPSVIREWREGFTAEAERLCDSVLGSGLLDGVRDLAQRYVHTAFPSALGIESHPENLLIVGHHNANAAGPRNQLFEETLVQLESIRDWYQRHQTREAMLPGGFGERVFDAEAGGELPPGVAGPVLRTLLRGGLDTTISGISTTLWLLATHPERWEALRRDPGLVPGAFEEALRLESPTPAIYRTTNEGATVAGIALVPDTKVQLFIGAANRDTRRWPDADEFDPARRARNSLIFGGGPHHCLGQRIARLEAECFLGTFVRRVASVELAGPPAWHALNMLRALERLPLRLVSA